MLQRIRGDLTKYHGMFMAGRCAGWELEELIVAAIKSDTRAQHHVWWKERGHDNKADVRVRTNGSEHAIQIKSGQRSKGRLKLSGHRLGRFKEDWDAITQYLNAPVAGIIAVPHRKIEGKQGRQHCYQVCYIDKTMLTGLDAGKWEEIGARYQQTNEYDVEFAVNPSMSWQVWWSIPNELIEETDEFVIG